MSRKNRNGNLTHQLEHAVHACSAFGESRYRAKNQSVSSDWKIYSREYRESLLAVAKDAGDYIRAHYPDTKTARGIKSYMLQAWIVDKAASCSQETLERYISNIHKIDNACRHVYGCHMRSDRLSTPDSYIRSAQIRTHSATDQEYVKLRDYLKGKAGRSDAWKSVVLSRCAGLRVRETAMVHRECVSFSGGKYGYGQITLRGSIDGAKNGRPRVVEIISPDHRDAIAECCIGVKPKETIIQNIRAGDHSPMKAESITTALNRACKAVHMESWEWQKSHPFRKAYAQECYDTARSESMIMMSSRDSRAVAKAFVNTQLGHGADRSDHTFTTYVAIRW